MLTLVYSEGILCHDFPEALTFLSQRAASLSLPRSMGGNQTGITEVTLLGFQVDSALEFFLFGLFSLFYTLTLLGNGVILGLICLDSRLHTPMYFFLSHLAIIDMSYASNNVPKMLANLVSQKRTISFVPCIMQTFLYLAFANTECLILVVMAYDSMWPSATPSIMLSPCAGECALSWPSHPGC